MTLQPTSAKHDADWESSPLVVRRRSASWQDKIDAVFADLDFHLAETTEPTHSTHVTGIQRPQKWIAMLTEPLAILFAGGLTLEIVVAAAMPNHALWNGGTVSLISAIYMIWFWLTTIYGIGLFTQFVRSREKNKLLAFGVLAAVAFAVFAYAVSWGIYLQTKRFANFETIRFMFFNWSMLEDYMLAADKTQTVWGAVVAVAVLITIPVTGRWVYQNTQFKSYHKKLRLTSAILLLGVVVGMNSLYQDLSWQRLGGNLNRLSSCLSPGASLFASALEVCCYEPIEDCLDEADLIPLSGQGIAAPARKLNVIIIAVESLRHDTIGLEHQGQPVLPNINRLANRSYVWSKAYAQSTHSDYADVCLVSSLYPLRSRRHHFYQHDDPWPKKTLYDVLQPHGYSTAIISSQNEAWGCMDAFLQTENLDFFYHPQNSAAPTIISERDPGFYMENKAGALVAGKFADKHTAEVAMDWVTDQVEQKKPFYLSMNLQSSHFPYLIPDSQPAPFQPAELPASVKFSSYDAALVPTVRNAYYNGIHECDRQIGRLIDHLKKMNVWENTLLVVTGENGEAFHENGCIGHACNANEPVIHIANIFSAPGILERTNDDYPFEHVDLCPTILGLIGSTTHGNFQGIDALAKDRRPINKRFLFSHVLSPIAEGDSVQYAGRWKFMTSKEFPNGQLFDLRNDSTESTDASQRYPDMRKFLSTALQTWRKQQLAYYYLPKYYTRYYPPQPPTVDEVCELTEIDFERLVEE